jgi:glycosyltransferase involved in cell wall biosynthesis
MSCLRWPSLEGGSASAIESMLYRKPTMVTDTGFYAEIPSDCVIKIAHEDEVANICSALEQLCSKPELREQIGERASRWAAVTYSADTYARQLVDMSRASQMARPVANAKAYFVQQMKRWGASDELLCDEGIVSSLGVLG